MLGGNFYKVVFVIKKIIVSLVLLAFILPCFSFSASAEDFSWKDYIKDVDVSNGLITISLPANPTTFDIYPSGREHESFNGVHQLYYQFESYEETGMSYSLQITPSSSNFLYLGNIPDDTELNIMLDIRSVINPEGDTVNDLPTIPAWNFETARYYAHMYLFNEAHERIAFRSMQFGQWYIPGQTEPDDWYNSDTVGSFYATATLSDVLGNFDDTEYLDNAQYFRGSYFFENMYFSSYTDCKISVTNYELVLHMDTLLSDTGEYSDILELILSVLAKRGETIDLLTGDIVPIPPSVQGEIDDVIDYENDFVFMANQGALEAGQLFTDGLGFITSISPALVACSTVLDKFINIAPFRNLIVVSISLGAFAFLLNIGLSVVKSLSNKDSKSRPKGGKSN